MDGYPECSALLTDVTPIFNLENQIFEFLLSYRFCGSFAWSKTELDAHQLFFDIFHLMIK
jgi:hypothetical protein